MTIDKLQSINIDDTKSINALLHQLSHTASEISIDQIKKIIKQENFSIYVARDDSKKSQPIIGIASIIFYNIVTSPKAIIEDVVVDSDYRGQGIGTKLMGTLVTLCREKDVKYIDLTSSPSRTCANFLYQKVGFEKRETNVYRLSLK